MIQFIALNHDIKYASDPGCKSKGDGFVGGTVGLKSSIQETTAFSGGCGLEGAI